MLKTETGPLNHDSSPRKSIFKISVEKKTSLIPFISSEMQSIEAQKVI